MFNNLFIYYFVKKNFLRKFSYNRFKRKRCNKKKKKIRDFFYIKYFKVIFYYLNFYIF